MIKIDYTSSKAIYEQIYEEITRLILSKALKPNEKLPSVRELASMIKINPNTIQKAYKFLELDEYIYTIKGKGNFIKNTDDLKRLHLKKMGDALKEAIISLKNIGMSDEKIMDMVKEILA